MQYISVDFDDFDKKVIDIKVCIRCLVPMINGINSTLAFSDYPQETYVEYYEAMLNMVKNINLAHFFLLVTLEDSSYYIIELLADGYYIHKPPSLILFIICQSIDCSHKNILFCQLINLSEDDRKYNVATNNCIDYVNRILLKLREYYGLDVITIVNPRDILGLASLYFRPTDFIIDLIVGKHPIISGIILCAMIINLSKDHKVGQGGQTGQIAIKQELKIKERKKNEFRFQPLMVPEIGLAESIAITTKDALVQVASVTGKSVVQAASLTTDALVQVASVTGKSVVQIATFTKDTVVTVAYLPFNFLAAVINNLKPQKALYA